MCIGEFKQTKTILMVILFFSLDLFFRISLNKTQYNRRASQIHVWCQKVIIRTPFNTFYSKNLHKDYFHMIFISFRHRFSLVFPSWFYYVQCIWWLLHSTIIQCNHCIVYCSFSWEYQSISYSSISNCSQRMCITDSVSFFLFVFHYYFV